MWKCFAILTRRKVLDAVQIEETSLVRLLNLFDLSSLGISSTLGMGMYVVVGNVARNIAGPSVVLSFLIAGVVSVLAGLCYAELGSRVPRAGSAYIYSYVCVGEFVAFIIGCNLIFEYIVGCASCSRSLSLHVDTFINNSLQNTFKEIAPINIRFMSSYFDFFAFGISILFAAFLAFGMKESAIFNNICTIITLIAAIFFIIVGSFKAHAGNWNLSVPVNSTYGHGGFFPYGYLGTLRGAATCFFAFIGFDSIAATGEEVHNPQKTIPLAIIITLAVGCFSYLGTSIVITMMVPYYMQNIASPLPYAFSVYGWQWAKWLIEVAALFGICSNLISTFYALPRILYGMATDAVIFRFLGRVNDRFHTPLIATLLSGLLIGLMAAMVDMNLLIDMTSIATLSAYTIVAASVLTLRYSVDENDRDAKIIPPNSNSREELCCNIGISETAHLISNQTRKNYFYLKQIFNQKNVPHPTVLSQNLVAVEVFAYILLCISLGLLIRYCWNDIIDAEFWPLLGMSLIVFAMLLVTTSIAMQPVGRTAVIFKVPLISMVPALSILMNISLMIMLDDQTWIRFMVWMALCLLVYGFYGYPNSKREYEQLQAEIEN